METRLDFYAIFSLIAVGQGVFLLLFLLLKKFKSLSFRLLALILVVLLFQLVHDQMVTTRLMLKAPFLMGTAHFFSYCIGPLILLYVLSLIKSDFRLRPIYLLHFLPFLVFNLYKLPGYLSPVADKLRFLEYYYQSLAANPTHFVEVRGFYDILQGFLLFDLHKLVYVAYAFYLFIQYKGQLLNRLSNLEKTNVRWMSFVLFGYAIIWLLIPIERFHGFYGIDSELVAHASALLLSVHIYFIAYQTFSQPDYTVLSVPSKTPQAIDKNQLTEILEAAEHLMKEEKRYLDPNLTLPKLAEAISVREHNLSKAINDQLNINFFDFVNRFRTEEARRMLSDPAMKKFTVEHIGEQAGFSSKTTFYRAFKKHCGMTPSKFQKDLPQS